MKLINIDSWNYSPQAQRIYSEMGDYHQHDQLPRSAFLALLPGADIIIMRLSQHFDREAFERADRLKYIVCNVTGLDHIDMDAAARRGVEVISLRGDFEFLRGIHATAELTWALLLDAMRHLNAAVNDTRAGHWRRNAFFGRELHGRTLGILGFGRIGEKVAHYAEAFGMQVMAYDPKPLSHNPRVTYTDSLEALLDAEPDILCVLVSYGHDTHHLLNQERLARLKPGTVLINTARGGIIDETALAALIRENHFAAVALDVLEGETDPAFTQTSELLELARTRSDVIVTPHIGGVTYDSWWKTELHCAEKLQRQIAAGSQDPD